MKRSAKITAFDCSGVGSFLQLHARKEPGESVFVFRNGRSGTVVGNENALG